MGRSFYIVYFILSFLGLLLYGIWAVRLTRLEEGTWPQFILVQRWVFSGLLLGTFLSLFVLSMIFSRNMVFHERRFTRISGGIYVLYMILTCSAFLLTGLHELLSFVFIFFFLSWHLIPILFMGLYLE